MIHESSILVCAPPRGFGPDALRVHWEPTPLTPSPLAAQRMRTQWQECLKDAAGHGRTLFDGSITRLIETRLVGTPAHPCVELRLGPGSYQAFVVTRLRDRAWFEAHAPESLTLALGNSVLLTHGNQTLLGIRSQNVSAYAGRAHQIGGVLEALDTTAFPANVEGVIAHLLVELYEEAHVEPQDLAPRYPLPHLTPVWPRFLGIFYDHVLGQPEMIWQWETETPLHHIAQRINKTEHDSHVIVARGNIPHEMHARLTPLAREALAAWSCS